MSGNADFVPASLGALLSARSTSTSPWLVDLGDAAARIELSGRVLCNWWAKDAALLAELCDVAEGSRVGFQVPAHWRTLPLVLAAFGLGATVVLDARSDVDVLVTDAPHAAWAARTPEVLAVTLEPLALDFGAPLPAGVIDHAGEVRGMPDQLILDPRAAANGTVEDAGRTLSMDDLLYVTTQEAERGAKAQTSSIARETGLLAATAALMACDATGSLIVYRGHALEAGVAAQERVTRGADLPEL